VVTSGWCYCSGVPLGVVLSFVNEAASGAVTIKGEMKGVSVSGLYRYESLRGLLDRLGYEYEIDFQYREGVYYGDGAKDVIEVIQNSGISEEIVAAIPFASTLDDKIVLVGKRSEVEQGKQAVSELGTREVERVRFYGVISDSSTINDLSANLEILATAAGGLASWGTVQEWLIDWKVRLAENSDRDLKTVINTDAWLVSGKEFSTFLGTERRLERYIETEAGNNVVSEYQYENSGTTVRVIAYGSGDRWEGEVSVEESGDQDELRTVLSYRSNVVFNPGLTEVVRLVRSSDDSEKRSFLGLHRLPGLGRLFPSSQVHKEVVFSLWVFRYNGATTAPEVPFMETGADGAPKGG
jgi:hypothetical protein